MKILGAMLLTLGLMGVAFAAETAPATATSKPATSMPACCGDKCKPMANCCKADANAKVSCGMGGGCCEKPK